METYKARVYSPLIGGVDIPPYKTSCYEMRKKVCKLMANTPSSASNIWIYVVPDKTQDFEPYWKLFDTISYRVPRQGKSYYFCQTGDTGEEIAGRILPSSGKFTEFIDKPPL